jgi:outer membrane protein TolC
VGAFFTALDEGNFGKAMDRWVGPSGSIQLQIEKPLGNNTQRGQLAQREAESEQLRIGQTDLNRQIKLSVVENAGTLQQTVARVQLAQDAVGFYQTVVDSEFARFGIGETTLLNTVVTQQQQNGALLALVAARQDLAQRIAQLRFQTGTLVTNGAVRVQDLVTVPAIGRQP